MMVSAARRPIRHVACRRWPSPEVSQMTVAERVPPGTRAPLNTCSMRLWGIGARQPGEVNSLALFALQVEPDSEYPASPARLAQASTGDPRTTAPTSSPAKATNGAEGSARTARMR